MEAANWRYPPDVPPSVQLRQGLVRGFLQRGSRNVAQKAYADFRKCYPQDHWPKGLLDQLGTQ